MKHSSRQLVFLCLTAFLAQSAIAMINLALVFYMKNSLGLSPDLVGVYAGTVSVAYCVSLILLKDRIGKLKPRTAVEISALGMAVSGSGIVFLGNVTAAFMLYIIYGISMSFLWPPLMGWISRGREGRELGAGLAGFNLSWSIGIFVGPYAAGLLAERSAGLAVYAAAGISATVLMLMLTVTALAPSIRAVESNNTIRNKSVTADASTPFRYISWAGLFTGYFVFGVVTNIFPMYAQDVLQYRESTIGFMLLLRGAATTVFFVLLGRWTFWHSSFRVTAAVQGIFLISCLLAMKIDSYWSILLFFIFFGMLFASLYTFSIFHGVSGSPDRESRMAIHESILTAGVLSGSVIGGYVYNYVSYQSTMAVSAAIIAAAGLVQFFLYRKKKVEISEHVKQNN